MPGIQTTQAGNGPTGMTNVSAAITNASATVTLVQPSVVVTITNNSSTAVLNISFSPPATTSNYAINPLQSYTYCGPPLTAVALIGTNSSGNYSILAF
jgi:hypothetical protein